MAYRNAPVLDFTGLRVVCLIGENGAGKSTLLDAITWVLWGQARSKRDDELISQGESEMRVGLVFAEGDNTYQVVRTRKLGRITSRTKMPVSTGNLELLVEDHGSWRTLTEGRTQDTQSKIINILNLTYETFVNSAFLKQGHADEFTLKTPGERKALLADILGLDAWSEYEERVKLEQKKLDENKNILNFDLRQTEEEIARLPEYEQDLSTAHQAREAASHLLELADSAMTEIERQRERAKGLRTQATRATESLGALISQHQQITAERQKHSQLLDRYQQVIAQHEEVEHGFAEFELANKKSEEFNLKLASLVELNARKTAAESKIVDERHNLENERDLSQQTVQMLEGNADTRTLNEQLHQTNEQLNGLILQQNARELWQREHAESRVKQTELRTHNTELRTQMNDLKKRIQAISSIAAVCPTCGRDLGENERQRLLAEWQEQGHQLGDTFRAAEEAIRSEASSQSRLEQQIAEADHTLARLPAVQRDVHALEDRLLRASDAAAQLPQVRATLEQANGRLNRNDYAHEARALLAEVLSELTELGYDAALHRQLRDEILPRLRVYVERKEQLDRSAQGIESEQLMLENLNLREAALSEQQRKGEEEVASLRGELAECEVALQRAGQVEVAAQRARLDFFAAQRKEVEANQRVQSCRALESKRVRLQNDLETLAKQQSHLLELRTAFGRNGVPAMIIEAILPELEDSARQVLSRMTNDRMSVRFETQKLSLRGELNETLELRISDELGERPYEMYSGGEAFRINFAVRIALSKLLANRAGAKLQTLFIDEGFGTQDAQGRERLIESIQSIQDEFDLIVAITHIEELKASFPAQIEVTKTSDGSMARVTL